MEDMDYKEEYERAFGIAKMWYKNTAMHDNVKEILNSIFPELKESEDEKIRKEIIEYIKIGTYHKDWISWLEKQGEKKPTMKVKEAWEEMRFEVYAQASGSRYQPYCSDNSIKMFSLNDIDNIIERINEKQQETFKEEKVDNANKVESKFNVGDWVVRGDTIAQILDIQEQYYVGFDIDGKDFTSSRFLSDDKIHRWTIIDAKDGDVLVCGSNVFIFRFINDTRLMGYCHVNTDDGRFYYDVGKNECFCLIDAVVHPATKKQRDLLFQKMKEAGYEWNAGKK